MFKYLSDNPLYLINKPKNMRKPARVLNKLFSLILIVNLSACSDNVDDTEQVAQQFAQHMTNAATYRNAGQLEEAVIEMKNALLLKPDSFEARATTGELYLLLGNATSADKEFRHIQEGRGNPALYMVKLGDTLLRLHAWQDVLDRIRADPALPITDQARIYAQRGSAYIGKEDIEAARKAFTTAIELDANCVPAWLGQAALAMSDGRQATTRQLIKQAQAQARGEDAAEAWRMMAELTRLGGDNEAAITAYSEAIKLSAFKWSLMNSRALLNIEMGNYEMAHQDLDAVAEKYPRHPDLLYGEGLLAIREARFTDARSYLEELKQIAPDHIQGLFYLGVAHYAEGNPRDAEPYLTSVVAQKRGSVSAIMLLGRVRYNLGEYHSAARILEPLLPFQPENSELQSLLGSIYLATGKTAHGSELLRTVVAREPENAPDRIKLGLSLIRLGENEEGVRELERVATDAPESDHARITLMIGYVNTGNYKAAREIARKMQEEAPNKAAPWNYLGMVEIASGEQAAARHAFEQALAISPAWPAAGFNLARLELSEGNIKRVRVLYEEILSHHPHHLRILLALASLETAEGNTSTAEQLVKRAMTHNPNELAPRLWLARKHLAEGDTQKSLELFEEVEKHYREDPGFLAVLGEAQLRAGKTMAGMKTHQTLAKLAPEDAHIQYMHARACAIYGDYLCLGEALIKGLRLQPEHPGIPVLLQHLIALSSSPASLNKLLWRLQQAAPDNSLLIRVRGEYAMRTNQIHDAIVIYREARDRFPTVWHWSQQLAHALARNGDQVGALSIIHQWVATHPEEASAWLLEGKILQEGGKTEQAREIYAHVLALEPDNVQALNNLAWILREHDPEKAKKYAEQAVALAPGYITRDTLGTILLQLGENEQAEQLLREAFGEQPESATIRYHLATALANLKRIPEARSLLKEVLQDNPEFAEHGEAEALLERLSQ
jgi:putative PEP-CTERM system TPR-repeat lipoprotein